MEVWTKASGENLNEMINICVCSLWGPSSSHLTVKLRFAGHWGRREVVWRVFICFSKMFCPTTGKLILVCLLSPWANQNPTICIFCRKLGFYRNRGLSCFYKGNALSPSLIENERLKHEFANDATFSSTEFHEVGAIRSRCSVCLQGAHSGAWWKFGPRQAEKT